MNVPTDAEIAALLILGAMLSGRNGITWRFPGKAEFRVFDGLRFVLNPTPQAHVCPSCGRVYVGPAGWCCV